MRKTRIVDPKKQLLFVKNGKAFNLSVVIGYRRPKTAKIIWDGEGSGGEEYL
jgi:hypothetical protein